MYMFDEVANAIHGANMQWRARSYAASVPSHMPKSHKAQKRVSKDDRRAMVESYVNKYRETHAGKFPSISDARKQAGGTYYFIREIVHELEYKSKVSSPNSGNKNVLGKELPIVSEPLVKVKNMSTGGAMSDMRTQCDPRAVPVNDVGDTSYRYLEVEGGLQTCEKMVSQEFGNPISPEHSDAVGTQGNLLEGIDKEASHLCPEKSAEHEVKETQNDHSGFVVTDGNSHFAAAESHMRKHETKNVSHPGLVEAENDQEKLSAFKRVMDADHSKHNEGSPYLDKHEKYRETHAGESPSISGDPLYFAKKAILEAPDNWMVSTSNSGNKNVVVKERYRAWAV
ncbi:hypothetical protein POTOM_057785 [Populus tomentosa]|uniref:AT3G52170-like helix-turn-helix domain-containing protein n=1 Tax=Populus tomentosa TaxID=118781 RepID=A0A8X7Y0B9_POPTO|nr:hypothetical protein POTOM_057785 [Populus tomentosa]